MDMSHAWHMLDWIAADGFSRLGVALGHFLWQGCVVALLYAVAAWFLRGASANTRYVAGVAALLLMAACLPVTLVMIQPSETVERGADVTAMTPEQPEPVDKIAIEPPLLEPGGPPLPSFSPTEAAEIVPRQPVPVVPASPPPGKVPSPGILARLLPWASILYLCGVFAMLLRVALGLWGGRRLRRDSTPVADTAILASLGEHARRMGMRAAPLIAACGRVSVPLVVGIVRPMILIPSSLISGLTPGELEAVLVHELAHIRRFDPVVNVLQRLVEAVLFFHPAVWWVSRCVSVERENACDDLVLRTNCGRNEYASALVHMAELCVAGGSPAMIRSSALAATGKNGVQFRRRVLRVLKHEERIPVRLTAPGIVVSMLLILALMLAPAAWRGMAWAKGEGEKTTPVPLKSSEEHKPVSMSAEEFARLSAEEQKALLVSVFERRLEHSRNLYYELDQTFRGIENPDGKAGKPPKRLFANRCQYRHWRVGDSYRMDTKSYRNLEAAEPSSFSSIGVNAVEGLGRNISIPKDGKTPPSGDVQYPFDPAQSNLYLTWLSFKDSQDYPVPRDYLFSDLLDHKDDFKIEAPVAGDKVRLTVPWQPKWNGNRVFILDPKKGFLPVRCDSSFDCPLEDGRPMWRKERFTVEDSRLVGDVWMPVWLKTELTCSSGPDMMNANEAKVTRIEHGTATAADIRVPFTEGMVIHDVVEGAIYTADAQGRPGPDLKLAPNWKHRPPKGWKRGDPGGTFSMASRFSPADRESLAAAQGKIDDKRARLEDTLNVLQSNSTVALEDRIEAGLKILREYHVGENQPIWTGAIRELTEIGKPAVPKLVEELDRTERANTLRALAFILRGIDDPRAVPALIRAIPRTFQAGGGDYGLRVDDDPDLAKFMGSHDTGKGSGTGGFNYGAPRREIMPTLEKLTHHAIPHNDLRFAYFEGGAKQRRLQQELFLKFTRQWADWLSEHWRDVIDNENEAQLDLIEESLGRYAERIAQVPEQSVSAGFPNGPNVVVSDGTMNFLIRSFKERPEGGFLDLDSGRHPRPSKAIIDASAEDEPSKELLDWAEKEGVDLITLKVKNPGGEGFYHAFWPVGMKVWRIDNDRYDKIEKELRQDKPFELPKPWQGPLALIDEKTGKYEKKSTASYLFITKEGTCGRLQLNGPLYEEYGVGAGGSGGLRFDFVYEGEGESEQAESEAETTTPVPLNSFAARKAANAALAKTVHGKVVDENGTPIAGADVWMMPVYDPVKENPAAHATTDAQGRFTLAVHALSDRDLKRVGWPYSRDLILAHADGRQLGTGLAGEQMAGQDKSDLVIRLKPAAETEFVVLGPDGKPKAGAVIEPRYLLVSPRELPKEICTRVAARTDAEGRAVLTAFPRDAINFIDIATDDLGIQRQYLIPKGGGGIKDGGGGMAFPVGLSAGEPIRLRQGGTVVGRITAEKPEWTRGVRVMVTTSSPGAPIRSTTGSPVAPNRCKDTGISTTTGFADVVSDEKGRFEVPIIAAGSLIVNAVVDDRLPLLPIEPDGSAVDLRSRPGETTELELPLVRTISAVGSVRVEKSGEPIPKAVVQIARGTNLMQYMLTMTDAEGNYTASVLPGKNSVGMTLPPESKYRHLRPGVSLECEVPEDAKEFRIPVLEVGEKKAGGDSSNDVSEAIDRGMKADEFERSERGPYHY